MICRDCKRPGNIKYAVRHYLCAKCAISRGFKFLRGLTRWQLESLPAMPLKRAGLYDVVSDEILLRCTSSERG